ncbi:hypothetical protein KGF54_001876 [Candida jiufengensis]|uniref:uncharacterized protein n=1 Tax=Candida jiufengensis TaxID=497108 RepID=UPI0022248F48|nr:uncharacterized protein KGF54_001876 [Candida jiufengensis]KAI5955315.1 hypothetical protein KGF54_001876 [Candida jiufengensis]
MPNFRSVFGINEPRRAPRGKQISGDYKELIPHVINDIQITKSQLNKYQNNSLLNKLILLIEENHLKQINEIKKLYINENSKEYQIKLFELLKINLDELCNLLDIFKNNFIHSLYDNNLLNYKINQIQSTTTNSSRSSISDSSTTSLSSLSMVPIDDEALEEAPDYLLDPISFEILTDPVITPSGITYEKQHLLRHIKNKGKFDPISKQPLNKDQLYPNLIIKDSIEAYKMEHSK